ncbi:hypothetical protein IE077_002277 [Cardiosporidium cionae]|uniref:t-SNARE coiled-coil homology domain-containing protein n=1 Tax=Cardiosporidium cionae TaxID=476202 RepID=A0ABQ7JBB3_9APIC|nr:hypothetical protein IE077_002277 [Cardiosporidium cionae]|eukprot:KAF8821235.1 hypothetical protein IE077_002277 [Cardiosporidium cionae]
MELSQMEGFDRTHEFLKFCKIFKPADTDSGGVRTSNEESDSRISGSPFMELATVAALQLAILATTLQYPAISSEPLLHGIVTPPTLAVKSHGATRYSRSDRGKNRAAPSLTHRGARHSQAILDEEDRRARTAASTQLTEECYATLRSLESLIQSPSSFDISEGPSESLVGHRHGVVSSLYGVLQRFTVLQKERETAELQRLHMRKHCFSSSTPLPPLYPSRISNGLPPEEELSEANEATSLPTLRNKTSKPTTLEAESALLLPLYEKDSDRLWETQKKIHEIASLMDTFSLKVSEQSEMCEQISVIAETSVGDISQAKQQLSKALEKTSNYHFYLILFFSVASCILLFLDLIKSSSWY